MKVILLNGSPRANGCTHTALKIIEKELINEGIEVKFYEVGNKAIIGCTGCGACRKLGECVHGGLVNEVSKELESSDGFIVGSPVHYAAASGAVTSFLDRLFYSTRFDKRMKVGASIAVARRGGCSATFDQLNKYFTISGMPLASSQYWNSVHGAKPGQVEEDLEGMQTMRTLAHNMSFLIKSIALGKEKYGLPEREKGQYTNFIR